MSKHGGFSLVELLVSTVLLSSIVLLASYSYSQFVQYWDGRLGKFDEAFEELRQDWLVDQLLKNLTPYVVLKSDGLPVYYFEGNVNGFVAVSKQAITQPERPAVVRLSLIQIGDNTFDLTLEEAPMQSSALATLTQIPNFGENLTILRNLGDARFDYYGTEPPSQESAGENSVRRWSSQYNSAVTGEYPLNIRLIFTYADREYRRVVNLIQPSPGQRTSMIPDELGL